jgi:bacillithiol biosynthesis deacetylase BshB1
VNLRLPDRAINSELGHIRTVTGIIRRARPRVVAAPYWSDRHPDHVNACTLIVEAVLNAGLRRYAAEAEPWKVQRLCHYFLNEAAAPSFVVDVSDQYALKQRALACHATQFSSEALATRPNVTRFLQLIESRDANFGAQVGVAYAEGLVTKRLLVASDLIDGLIGA